MKPSNHLMRALQRLAGALAMAATLLPAARADIGQVKVAQGQVQVERKGQRLPVAVGLVLETADVLHTGANGSVGVTMRDDTRLSVGPNSILSLAQFSFEASTSVGRLDTQLQRGTLAVVSGRIARQSPAAMTVRTPAAVLAARGTEFVVEAP